MESSVYDLLIAAAASEPVHVWFAAEPGELALGVVAMALLGLSYCLFPGEFVLQDSDGFGVAERGEGATLSAVTGNEAFCLFNQAAVKHRCSALVDAFVETFTWRIEAELQDAIAGEGVAAFLPLCGERALCRERDFNSADDFGNVVDVNGCCGGWIETREDTMKVCRTSGLADFAETFALAGLLGWGGEEPFDERAQIKAGAASDDGQVASVGNSSEDFTSLTAVVPRGAGFIWPDDVDHVVPDEGAFFERGLGCADFHLAINGYGVTADDLAMERFGEAEC